MPVPSHAEALQLSVSTETSLLFQTVNMRYSACASPPTKALPLVLWKQNVADTQYVPISSTSIAVPKHLHGRPASCSLMGHYRRPMPC